MYGLLNGIRFIASSKMENGLVGLTLIAAAGRGRGASRDPSTAPLLTSRVNCMNPLCSGWPAQSRIAFIGRRDAGAFGKIGNAARPVHAEEAENLGQAFPAPAESTPSTTPA